MRSYRVVKRIKNGSPYYEAEYRPFFWPFWFEIYQGSNGHDEESAWRAVKTESAMRKAKPFCWMCALPPIGIVLMLKFVVYMGNYGALGVYIEEGCIVASVLHDSPAAHSRIKKGDEIIKTNNGEGCSRGVLRDSRIVIINRDGKEIKINVKRR